MIKEHPWSADRFRIERTEQFDFVCKYKSVPNLIIFADVKSGKRQIEEVEAILDRGTSSHGREVRHLHLTALLRKDTKDQESELKHYMHKTFFGAVEMDECYPEIDKLLKEGCSVVVHLDESDYGTGSRQALSSRVWPKILAKQRQFDAGRVKIRLYSATNEEALYSDFSKDAQVVYFRPNENYVGAGKFLERGLVEAPIGPAWDLKLNDWNTQVQQVFRDWAASDKEFMVIRIANWPGKKKRPSDATMQDAFRKYIPEGQMMRADARNAFHWGKPPSPPDKKSWINLTGKNLLYINQVCSRSTEVAFHDKIYAWYDYRGATTFENTARQAAERVIHYRTAYEIEPKIRVFVEPELFMRSAGFSPDNYSRKLSVRIANSKAVRKINLDGFTIHRFDTLEELEEYGKEVFGHRINRSAVTFKEKTDPPYHSRIRGRKEARTVEEIWKDRLLTRQTENDERWYAAVRTNNPAEFDCFVWLVHDGSYTEVPEISTTKKTSMYGAGSENL